MVKLASPELFVSTNNSDRETPRKNIQVLPTRPASSRLALMREKSCNIEETVSVDALNAPDNQTHLAEVSNASVSQMTDSVNIIRPRILGLLLDVKTRWNSSYVMLHRGYKLRKAIEMYISGDPAVKQFQLTNEEWDNLSEILVLLKPLYIATICLSKSKFPSLSTTLPIYICLLKVFFYSPTEHKVI